MNSREATPSLYLRYVTYESNISLLLSKRLNRLAVPPKSAQKLRVSQQRRLFNILDRATTRFKGDLGLWAQYLHFCREQAAIKRGQKVLSQCLRLHPTRPEVWGYAAGWAEGSGDLSAARGYYLRGLRFCGDYKGGRDLYIRFARAEMRWVGERRKIVGLQDEPGTAQKALKAATVEHREEVRNEELDANAIARPAFDQENQQSQAAQEDSTPNESSDPNAFHHFSSTPAMTGAIPIAIFDQAMKAHNNAADLAEAFFDMFAQFQQLSCSQRVLQHVVNKTSDAAEANDATMQSCRCRLPLIGPAVDSPEFPAAVRRSLAEIKASDAKLTDANAKSSFAKKVTAWLQPLAAHEKLVPELRTVLNMTARQLTRS